MTRLDLSVLTVILGISVSVSGPGAPRVAIYPNETIIVPVERFSETRLVKLCRAMLRKERTAFRSVWFYTAAAYEQAFRARKRSVHYTYSMWLYDYKDVATFQVPVAQMVSIRDGAVLLIRHPDRGVSRIILSGTDPLTLKVAGSEIQLLDFEFVAARSGKVGEAEVYVYAWTQSTLTDELTREVFQHVESLLPMRELTLRMRNDPWFIDDPHYPVSPVFVEGQRPPTRDEYSSSVTYSCGRDSSGRMYCGRITTHK